MALQYPTIEGSEQLSRQIRLISAIEHERLIYCLALARRFNVQVLSDRNDGKFLENRSTQSKGCVMLLDQTLIFEPFQTLHTVAISVSPYPQITSFISIESCIWEDSSRTSKVISWKPQGKIDTTLTFLADLLECIRLVSWDYPTDRWTRKLLADENAFDVRNSPTGS